MTDPSEFQPLRYAPLWRAYERRNERANRSYLADPHMASRATDISLIRYVIDPDVRAEWRRELARW